MPYQITDYGIVFDNLTCCALFSAYNNTNDKFKKELGNFYEARLVSLNISMINPKVTVTLGFNAVLYKKHLTFYKILAETEIEKIANNNATFNLVLSCSHTKSQHFVALSDFLKKAEQYCGDNHS